jgi:hypothetical protein
MPLGSLHTQAFGYPTPSSNDAFRQPNNISALCTTGLSQTQDLAARATYEHLIAVRLFWSASWVDTLRRIEIKLEANWPDFSLGFDLNLNQISAVSCEHSGKNTGVCVRWSCLFVPWLCSFLDLEMVMVCLLQSLTGCFDGNPLAISGLQCVAPIGSRTGLLGLPSPRSFSDPPGWCHQLEGTLPPMYSPACTEHASRKPSVLSL